MAIMICIKTKQILYNDGLAIEAEREFLLNKMVYLEKRIVKRPTELTKVELKEVYTQLSKIAVTDELKLICEENIIKLDQFA